MGKEWDLESRFRSSQRRFGAEMEGIPEMREERPRPEKNCQGGWGNKRSPRIRGRQQSGAVLEPWAGYCWLSWENSGRNWEQRFPSGLSKDCDRWRQSLGSRARSLQEMDHPTYTQHPTPLLPGIPGLCAGCVQGLAHPSWLTTISRQTLLFSCFLTTHREAISKSCLNLCRGSKAKSEDHPSRPHHHLSGLSRHHLTSAPCSIPHIRPREGLLRCELQHVTLTWWPPASFRPKVLAGA